MPTKIILMLFLSLTGELVAGGTSLTTRAAKLFQSAMVGGALSLATVVQVEPAGNPWQDVQTDDVGYRRSVFYLRIQYRNVDYMLHLAYLGDNGDRDKVFVGILPQALRADEPMGREARKAAEYSLYAHEGLVAEHLGLSDEGFYPVKDSGEILAVDVVVAMFSGLDISDYQPVVLDKFPDRGDKLEVLKYHPDRKPNVLRWQSCQAGKYNLRTGLSQHTCHLPWQPPNDAISSLGAPMFNDSGQLVGFTAIQSDARQRHFWPTDDLIVFSDRMLQRISIPKNIENSRLSTTWAELKGGNR